MTSIVSDLMTHITLSLFYPLNSNICLCAHVPLTHYFCLDFQQITYLLLLSSGPENCLLDSNIGALFHCQYERG